MSFIGYSVFALLRGVFDHISRIGISDDDRHCSYVGSSVPRFRTGCDYVCCSKLPENEMQCHQSSRCAFSPTRTHKQGSLTASERDTVCLDCKPPSVAKNKRCRHNRRVSRCCSFASCSSYNIKTESENSSGPQSSPSTAYASTIDYHITFQEICRCVLYC